MTRHADEHWHPRHRHDAEEASKDAARAEFARRQGQDGAQDGAGRPAEPRDHHSDAIDYLVQGAKVEGELRREVTALQAEVERLKAACKPTVDYCEAETYTLDYSDIETHCVRLVVRDLGISDAELSALRPRAEAAEAALAEERAKVARVEAAVHDHPDCIGECACAVLAVDAALSGGSDPE